MAIAHVQTNGTQTDTPASTTATHRLAAAASNGSQDVTAGSLLVCAVGWTPAATVIDSVTSSPAGTWTPLTAATDGNFGLQQFYCENVTGGDTTVTVTFHATGITFVHVSVCELSGVATSGALDASTSRSQASPGTGADAVDSLNPGNTAAANEWAVAAVLYRGAGGSVVPGTNPNTFTERYEYTDTFFEFEIETALLASAGIDARATVTVDGAADATIAVATFKVASPSTTLWAQSVM